ncbi:MAG: hypothetical protein AMXMBFR7_00200 [Planctomycetota bacterium]
MRKLQAWARVAAVISAVVLFGAYVWLRSGASRADSSEAEATSAPLPLAGLPAPEATEEPIERGADPIPAAVKLEGEAAQRMLMKSSKSAPVEFPVNAPPREVIMSGSKSEKIVLPVQAAEPPQRQMIMSGSKSAAISPQAPEPPPKPKRQVLMSGSKSRAPMPAQQEEAVQQQP